MPLDWAVMNGHTGVVNVLIAAGVDMNAHHRVSHSEEFFSDNEIVPLCFRVVLLHCILPLKNAIFKS
jgi:hypothetical protein